MPRVPDLHLLLVGGGPLRDPTRALAAVMAVMAALARSAGRYFLPV
jgi:hypothetical protein